MNRFLLNAVVIATFAFPIETKAQVSELIEQVSESEIGLVRAKNDYFIQKHQYFAKRYRVVRVNTEVLEEAANFTITLFPDVSFSVARTELRTNSDRTAMYWKGKLTNVPTSIEDIQRSGRTQTQAEIIHENLYGIRIAAAKYKYDENDQITREISPTTFDRHGNVFSQDSDGALSQIYGISTTIFLPSLGTEYQIRALELDSRYHIILEIDPNMRIVNGAVDSVDDPETAEKMLQYQEFLKALGDDPRHDIRSRDPQR